MPILDAEEYESLLKEKNIDQPERFKAEEGQALIYFTAFINRDSLSEIADEIGMDEDAWNENFKYSEEWDIEAIVDLDSGNIIKSRLV